MMRYSDFLSEVEKRYDDIRIAGESRKGQDIPVSEIKIGELIRSLKRWGREAKFLHRAGHEGNWIFTRLSREWTMQLRFFEHAALAHAHRPIHVHPVVYAGHYRLVHRGQVNHSPGRR